MLNIIKKSYILFCAGIVNDRGEVETKNETGHTTIFISFPTKKCSYCVVREYYKNGNTMCEIEYKETGHNRSTWYYESGNKSWTAEYQNEKYHGKYISWWKNGNKEREEEWSNGELNCKGVYWCENGNKWCEYEYKNGVKISERHY